MSERTININEEEASLALRALACLLSRTADVDEVNRIMALSQRVEGFEINGRKGAANA